MFRSIPLLVFAVLWIHGGTLGLTDDEAYYWVLSQKPALGYAFHPPAIAWLIAGFQALLGWLPEALASAVARLPAALISAVIVAMAMRWIELAGASRRSSQRGIWAFVAFAGVFGASWMIVPDLPLLLGWMILFVSCWRICFESRDPGALTYAAVALGVAIGVLSKFSAVIAAGSAGLVFLLWCEGGRRVRAVASVLLGLIVASVPILLWNARNEWGALLYQLSDRHGGQFSVIRYARFWVIQAVVAGPLMVYAFLLPLRWRAERTAKFAVIWGLPPALVFCIQPAWADFKPHWALVVWLPAALHLAWASARGFAVSWGRAQAVYGLSLIAAVLLLCHLPVVHFLVGDPRLDVGNDMYGWDRLRSYLRTEAPDDARTLPVVGSRYQTASQAAFALRDPARVTLLPRDRKQLLEWPDLGVSDHQGPQWPRLTRSVLYVADNRYTAVPEFSQSRCQKLTRLETLRAGKVARWIDVWRCDPST